MTDEKGRGGADETPPTSSCSEVTVCSERFERRRWFDSGGCCDGVPRSCGTTAAAAAAAAAETRTWTTSTQNQRTSSKTIGRSRAATDLTGGSVCGRVRWTECRNCCRHRGGGMAPTVRRERYGPDEPAGTFEMAVTAVRRAARGQMALSAVEFAVWRNRTDGRRGALLWFRGRKTMAAAAAMAVRALEVWTDPDDGRCPSKVVFLNE